MASDRTFALVGNPNTGKTTLFNALTGLRQKVANYPGVTVAGTGMVRSLR
jgi:ferrous iron transport protein B